MSEITQSLLPVSFRRPSADSDAVEAVLPTAGPDGVTAFRLPRFPDSTLNWLAQFGHQVWEERGTCCSLLVLVNEPLRTWGLTVPPQTPHKDGVTWTLGDLVAQANQDLPGPPLFAAGSFQTTWLRDTEELMSLVPPVDGLHLVMPLHVKPGDFVGVLMFLRVGGELVKPQPDRMVVDDWACRIDQIMKHLPEPV